MKKILLTAFMLLAIPIFSNAETKKTAIYFYADWCPHCQKVNAYFKQQGFYDKYDIKKLNFDEKQNQELLGKIFEDQGSYSGAGIPAIIIDDQMLVGDQPIIEGFEAAMTKSNGSAQEYVNSVAAKSSSSKAKDTTDENVQAESMKTSRKESSLPIVLLLGAAFADAANPCALAVLILLLATVIAAKGKNYALLSGLMFSLAIFISYLLMGIGLYRAITVFNIGRYLSVGAGILAVIIALANFKDVFWYGKYFIMEVPLSWRPKMQEIIRKATSPWSAFGIGFVVSLFLVPCASGPYVSILAKLAERTDIAKTFSLLMLYNLVFVSPMLIITLAMYFFDAKMKKLENWRKNNLQLLHAFTGIIMLVLGIYLIYSRY